MRNLMSGCVSRKRRRRGRSHFPAKLSATSMTSSLPAARPRTSSSASSTKARAVARRRHSRPPLSVSVTLPPGVRANNRTFRRFSRDLTWWLTAEGVNASSSAARLKLRCRAADSKTTNARSGAGADGAIGPPCELNSQPAELYQFDDPSAASDAGSSHPGNSHDRTRRLWLSARREGPPRQRRRLQLPGTHGQTNGGGADLRVRAWLDRDRHQRQGIPRLQFGPDVLGSGAQSSDR